jgi:DUF1680 family protein
MVFVSTLVAQNPAVSERPLPLASSAHARFHFDGVAGQRIDANLEHWLLPAPSANPGMIGMFNVRDRQPAPNLVPWAGEFVGKYLLSAIPMLRLSDRPELRGTVSNVVAQLIATQADDGYLGPVPKASRLLGNWDLWGHYHCIEALLLWHEETGDEAALAAARRAGDLVCQTFLGTGRRVLDAGSPEMNMAILHGLGQLYRVTGEARYGQMMREIEKDWERAGDYLRTGLAGKEFFQTPSPRWESLHDLQGLLELYRSSGEAKYRVAFEHHWRSIRRCDRRNTGGFSSGEQATGNPYAPTAIETCCTIAWMALSLDMLRLTGDPLVADDLELATFNAWAGAQHPSGRWCTYSTPMDGAREASAHTIVFQARAGTPELNCCSVNGPRGWGMLPDWAVMKEAGGLVVNYLGPFVFEDKLEDGTPVKLRCETDYPLSGKIRLLVEPAESRRFKLQFRVPSWALGAEAQVNHGNILFPNPGRYLALQHQWNAGDEILLTLPMTLRAVPGQHEQRGSVSLYRGPLLLAYDQRFNAFDETAMPVVDTTRLKEVTFLERSGAGSPWPPWLWLELSAVAGGPALRLCDFASAGATGTRYRSWLPATNSPPAPVVTQVPADGAAISASRALFRWTKSGRDTHYRLQIAASNDFTQVPVEMRTLSSNRVILNTATWKVLAPSDWYFWRVLATNAHGETESASPSARFRLDASLPPYADAANEAGPEGWLVEAPLRGDPKPSFGTLRSAAGFKAAAAANGTRDSAVELDGVKGLLAYAIDEFPTEDYTVSVRVCLSVLPEGHLGQIFSAWAGPMDDPLRLCVDRGKLYARIEAGRGFGTDGLPIAAGTWHHVAAVKDGTKLTLYVDGTARGTVRVPAETHSAARDVALGGNPHFGGNEFLAARFAEFTFSARAFSATELSALSRQM